jgi:hypothetical protein
MRVSYLAASLLAGVFANVSMAATITVNNPSFEDAGGGVPSWTSFHAGAYAPFAPPTFTSIPDGTKVAYLDNQGAYIYQTTSEPLTAGRIYSLSLYIGQRNDTYQPRTITTIMPASEIPDYLADPFGGSTDHLSFVQVEPEDVLPTEFKQFTTTFDTTLPANAALMSQYAGQSLVITVYQGGNGETDLDLVNFTYSEVPEPVSLALAMPALMLLRRRGN